MTVVLTPQGASLPLPAPSLTPASAVAILSGEKSFAEGAEKAPIERASDFIAELEKLFPNVEKVGYQCRLGQL